MNGGLRVPRTSEKIGDWRLLWAEAVAWAFCVGVLICASLPFYQGLGWPSTELGIADATLVCLTGVVTAAWVYTLNRWLTVRPAEDLCQLASAGRRASWVLWSGLMFVAWILVARGVFEGAGDVSGRVMTPASAVAAGIQGGANGASEGMSSAQFLVGSLGAVVAVVTAVFLVVLYRTADEGKELIRELKGYAAELDERRAAERLLARDLRHLEADSEVLRRRVLLPLVGRVEFLTKKAGVCQGNSKEWNRLLLAQIGALNLVLSDTPARFRDRWQSLRRFPPHLVVEVSHFARKAERLLDDLIESEPHQLDLDEIRLLKNDLREWAASVGERL
jgi:hypothetical protein